MNTKDTEPPDLAKLAQFTGTAQYWRVARQFVITDGVKYLAESAACFWLIDAAISHLLEIGTADWFVLVRVEVSGSSAVMIYEDGKVCCVFGTPIPCKGDRVFSGYVVVLLSHSQYSLGSMITQRSLSHTAKRRTLESGRSV